jgi:hypothetical protein
MHLVPNSQTFAFIFKYFTFMDLYHPTWTVSVFKEESMDFPFSSLGSDEMNSYEMKA